MSMPLSIDALPGWQQSQPAPPPAVPAVQPVAPAPSGTGADSSTDAGQSGASGRGAIYVPQPPVEAASIYTKPAAAQGTVHPEPDSGTAAADAAAINTPASVGPAATKATIPHAAVNAAYAMVADAPGTMPASVFHPLAGGR